MKFYDVFLFDADGTLFDFDIAEANALKAMFNNYNYEYSEVIRLKYKEINEHLWKSFENGEIAKADLQSLRFSRLFNYLGINTDVNIFNENYLAELGKGAFLIDGAFEVCKNIISCNKKIYIVTNGILTTQKSRIELSVIKDFISGLFVSEHIGFQKPHILYFEYVFSQIPSGKDNILIVGDSLSADIAGGNNAGIDSCWLNLSGKPNNTEIIPTYEINSLNELLKFIV